MSLQADVGHVALILLPLASPITSMWQSPNVSSFANVSRCWMYSQGCALNFSPLASRRTCAVGGRRRDEIRTHSHATVGDTHSPWITPAASP